LQDAQEGTSWHFGDWRQPTHKEHHGNIHRIEHLNHISIGARNITQESQKGDVPIAIPKTAVDPHILARPERSFLCDLLNKSALSMT
jgi:hypothetical protein